MYIVNFIDLYSSSCYNKSDTMGMFDYVSFEVNCPLCKAVLNEFQTKESDCVLDNLSPLAVEYFYQSCPNCDVYIDFILKDSYKKENIESSFCNFLKLVLSEEKDYNKIKKQAKQFFEEYSKQENLKKEVLKRFRVRVGLSGTAEYEF